MTIIANTNTTYGTIGIREDLSDMIYDISPEKTPFMSNIGKSKATATFHEWQTYELDGAVDDNAALEGDDTTFAAASRTSRIGNIAQISDKNVIVSGTNDAVIQAGRADEAAFQKTKRGLELLRDIEKQMLSNKPSVAGNDTTARQSAGILAWLETNTSRGVGGSDGGFSGGIVAAATNGTLRNFTEALLKDVQQQTFTAGGVPTMLFMNGPLKQTFSGFAGIAETRVNTDIAAKAQSTIVGAADVYVGDFGTLVAVPHQYGMTARDVLLVDPSMASKATLRPMSAKPLAPSGDASKWLLLEEYTLEIKNEAAHGVVADVQPV